MTRQELWVWAKIGWVATLWMIGTILLCLGAFNANWADPIDYARASYDAIMGCMAFWVLDKVLDRS